MLYRNSIHVIRHDHNMVPQTTRAPHRTVRRIGVAVWVGVPRVFLVTVKRNGYRRLRNQRKVIYSAKRPVHGGPAGRTRTPRRGAAKTYFHAVLITAISYDVYCGSFISTLYNQRFITVPWQVGIPRKGNAAATGRRSGVVCVVVVGSATL